MDELSEEDKLIVARARKIQRFLEPAASSSPKRSPTRPASSSSLEDTIRSFKAIVDGEYDHLPEQAFYNGRHHRRRGREGQEARSGSGVSKALT